MRWRGRRQSSNIEDRRNMSAAGLGTGRGGAGLIRLLPVAFKFLGVKGTVVVVLGLVAFSYLGGDLGILTAPMKQSVTPAGTQSTNPDKKIDDEPAQFVSIVLADTEETWNKLFRASNRQYREPGLVLFRGATRSACGLGQAAMGPFYCPGDEKVYIDLSFYDELRKRHDAPGDFAQAYVIAHEVGHHVQTLLGISEKTPRPAKNCRMKPPTNSRFSRNSRPTVLPEYGLTTLTAQEPCWKLATSRRA